MNLTAALNVLPTIDKLDPIKNSTIVHIEKLEVCVP
jgi:hypothetical protein